MPTQLVSVLSPGGHHLVLTEQVAPTCFVTSVFFCHSYQKDTEVKKKTNMRYQTAGANRELLV